MPKFSHFGFLAIHDSEATGASGGLLLVNPIGRPVEFHCSTPVKPNRTQEILYGVSLREFLYCESIARELVNHAKAPLDVVLIQQRELIPLHAMIDTPMVLVDAAEEEPSQQVRLFNSREFHKFKLGNRLAAAIATAGEIDSIRNAAENFHAALPIDEPFERIQQAIGEAHAVAR